MVLSEEDKKELLKLIGKRIKDFAVGENGIDIIFDDGTILELYCLEEGWGFVISSEEEWKEEEES